MSITTGRTSAHIALIASASLAGPAMAQNADGVSGYGQDAASPDPSAMPIALTDFDVADYEGGFTANTLNEETVYGASGNELGEVQSIVVNGDNRIERLVLEIGGLLDIGDQAASVPFDQVDMTPGSDGIVVPIEQSNVDQFTLFDDASEGAATVSIRNYRTTDLIGDTIRLSDGSIHGLVTDLVFDESGMLSAIVANPRLGYESGGYYGYPFQGYGVEGYAFDPTASTYDLPYSPADLQADETFDYAAFAEGGTLAVD